MQQDGRLKRLMNIQEAIQQKQSIGSLLPMLSGLLHFAETTVDHANTDAQRLNLLAGYMAEIRHLLENVRFDSHQPTVVQESRRIAARYRDLEGRVKEMRNDCLVSGNRA